MKSIQLLTALSVLAVSCGDVETAGVSQAAVTPLQCPAGQIPFNFSAGSASASSDALRASGGANTIQALFTSTIHITAAFCNAVDTLATSARDTCEGRTSCSWNAQNCTGATQVRYTCSLDPDAKVRETKCTGANVQYCYHQIKCAQVDFTPHTPEPKVACVPESCHGRTRRDANLACVQDTSLPVEYRSAGGSTMSTTLMVAPAETSVPYAPFEQLSQVDVSGIPTPVSGTGITQHVLFPNTLYDFKMYFNYPRPSGTPNVAPQGALTIWAYDVFQKRSGETVKLFHCQMHSVDLRKYPAGDAAPGGGYRLKLQERFVMPRDCLDNSGTVNTNISGAARAAGQTELEWRTEWGTAKTKLAVSYGAGGDVVLLANTTEAELKQNCAPNPSDFFYDSASKVVDRAKYLAQREIPVETATFLSSAGQLIDESAASVKGRVFFRPTTLTSIGVTAARPKKLRQKIRTVGAPRGFLRVDVDWFMAGDTDNYFRDHALGEDDPVNQLFLVGSLVPLDAAGKPKPAGPDGYLRLGTVRVFSADATGSTYSANYPITEALRNRFIDPSSPLKIDEGGRNFAVQVCARWGDSLSYWVGQEVDLGTRRSGPQGTPYKAKIINGACTLTDVPMQLVIDNSIAPYAPIDSSPFSDAQPAGAGDNRMSQQFDNDNEEDCAPGTTECRTESTQALAGSGTFGGVIIESDITGTTAAGGATRVTAERNVKLLGFTIDEGDDEEDAVQVGGKPTVSFTIEPPFDALESALNQTSPPNMKWNAEYVLGQKGLGLGWGVKIPVRYGPVQGDVIFSTSVSAGLSAELTYAFSFPAPTTCTGTDTECQTLYELQSSMPFGQALDTCYGKGGRLAELSSTTEAGYVVGKIPDNGTVWLGGQAANTYVKPACVTGWTFAGCYTNHSKALRWLSNDEDFASSTSFSNFTADTNEIFGSGYSYTPSGSFVRGPDPEAVTLSSSKVIKPGLTSDTHPSICKYTNTGSVESHSLTAQIELAFGAGFGLAFCTPSDKVGICLEGGVTLIGVSLTPAVTSAVSILTDRAGRRGYQAKVSFNLSWDLKLLAGEVNVRVVFLDWFSFKYNLLQYSGFSIGVGGELAKSESVFRVGLQ